MKLGDVARGGAAGRAEPLAVHRAAVLAIAALWGDIISDIENGILAFFTEIWDGISSFFGRIFNAISSTFATIFSAPQQAITGAFGSLNTWASQYGPLAPLLTVAVVAGTFILGTWLVWTVVKVSVSEGEETGEEVEEGA